MVKSVEGIIRGLLAAACLAFSSGCTNAPAVHDARKAEKDGAAVIAYEDYCKAARKSPGDGNAVAGIKRTGPAAAAQWQTQAWQAMEQQRYGDAWRMLMRALEIRPDDPTIINLIRQLQAQHPTDVATARAEWLRSGSTALAMAGVEAGASKSESVEPARSPRPAGKGKPAESKTDRTPAYETPPPAALAGPVDTSNAPGETRDSGSTPAGAVGDTGRGPQAKASESSAPPTGGEADMTEAQRRHREWADAFARADTERSKQNQQRREDQPKPAETKKPAEPAAKPVEAKKPAEPAPVKPFEVRRVTPPVSSKPPAAPRASSADPADGQQPPRAAEGSGGFLVLRTLSKKDKVFPKEFPLIDGIVIKLKGTGDDPKVDLDLCDGKKRVKKFRGLKVGKSETFAGHSGMEFRLVILSIHHKTDTVRVGVQELPRVAAPVPPAQTPPPKN